MLCVVLPLQKKRKNLSETFYLGAFCCIFFRMPNHILKQNLWRINIVQENYGKFYLPGGPLLEKYIPGLSLRENWLHALCGGWTCSVLPFWTVWILEAMWKTANFSSSLTEHPSSTALNAVGEETQGLQRSSWSQRRGQVWFSVVVWPWLNTRCLPKPFYFFSPQVERGEKIQEKAHESRAGSDHSPIIITVKTGLTLGN